MEKYIIYRNNEAEDWRLYSFVEEGKEKNKLEKAKKDHQKDLEKYLVNKKYDKKYWSERYDEEKNRQYQVVTWEKFEELQREYYLNKTLIEVTEEEWDEQLNVLPPYKWGTVNGVNEFMMSEFTTGSYTTQYAKYQGKFYCKTVDSCDPNTWIDKILVK